MLNSWETDKLREIRRVNPQAKVLVYKDLASTRSYPGAVDDGADTAFLPTGVGYVASQSHPEWFARDQKGDKIEWSKAYPGHWQMAVWDPGYQRAWVDAVTHEVVDNGWDGVLADNDLWQLHYYSDALFAGTTNADQTNQQLRGGLDTLVDAAGTSLNAAGKLFVPNIPESRLAPGRWSAHSRFGGGMEENFSYTDSAAGILAFQPGEWNDLVSGYRSGKDWLLLVTRATSEQERETGFAAAALLAGDRTCWMPSSTSDYSVADWSAWQDLDLGKPVSAPKRRVDGTWERTFSQGWVVVNPTAAPLVVTAPEGLRTTTGDTDRKFTLSPGQGKVLVS